LSEAAPYLSRPSVLWQPLMTDVRKLPAFRDIVQRLVLVDYWRSYGWADFCHSLSDPGFAVSR
jgi:hypothetical protein